jgi:hypothetical protein
VTRKRGKVSDIDAVSTMENKESNIVKHNDMDQSSTELGGVTKKGHNKNSDILTA